MNWVKDSPFIDLKKSNREVSCETWDHWCTPVAKEQSKQSAWTGKPVSKKAKTILQVDDDRRFLKFIY